MEDKIFLDILYAKAKELNELLQADNNNYTKEQLQYLISGYIVELDSILETGIGELHSPELDKLTSLIYHTRQKVVHYGYFGALNDIVNEAQDIAKLTLETYEKERKFQTKLYASCNFSAQPNVVISNSPNIEKQELFYNFKSKDGKYILSVPLKRVFELTDFNHNKIQKLIINTNDAASLTTLNDDGAIVDYAQLNEDEIRNFFKENYFIHEENTTKHIDAIKEVTDKFFSDPLNTCQIREYQSNEQFCKNTIDVIKYFTLENQIYEGFLTHRNFIERRVSMPSFNYANTTQIAQKMKKNIENGLSTTDPFYVDTTLKLFFDHFLKEGVISYNSPAHMTIPILIQLFEIGPKNFSDSFIKCNKEFSKAYESLHRYRQIFSHYLLNDEKYETEASNFLKEFYQFACILKELPLKNIGNKANIKYTPVMLIERGKEDFFNYKHEQFLKYSNKIYIGKKIKYSAKPTSKDSIVAIIPDQPNGETLCYKKDKHGFLNPLFTIQEKTNKKKYVSIHDFSVKGFKNTKVDFALTELYKAYNALRLQKRSDIEIHFSPCEDNGRKEHYDNLENVILRCKIQGYLPIELLQQFKADVSKANRGQVFLLDKNNNVIAQVINPVIFKVHKSYKKDGNDVFSRIDMIEHDFNKRRRK